MYTLCGGSYVNSNRPPIISEAYKRMSENDDDVDEKEEE